MGKEADKLKEDERKIEEIENLKNERIKVYQKVKKYREIVGLLKSYRTDNHDEI